MTFLYKFCILFSLTIASVSAEVFETLAYGDSQEAVTQKLKQSKLLIAPKSDELFARTGLNGEFTTQQTLNGLHFALYFGWNDDDNLKSITLRSDSIENDQFDSTLTDTFAQAVSLLAEVYGKPVLANKMPGRDQIIDNESIINSHLWHLEEGSLLLGVAQIHGKYHVSIRYLQKRIEL